MAKHIFANLLGLAAALALSATPAAANETDDIVAAAQGIFAVYTDEVGPTGPDWELPVYSAETTALISEWKKGLKDGEVEELNDFGWLCECQDFGEMTVTFDPDHAEGSDRATVNARLDLGWDGEIRDSKLLLVKEGGQWMLDDLFSASFPDGLKAELRKAIAAHKAR